jgi:hypothetical protein
MMVKALRQPREGEAVASAGSEQVAGKASAEATTWIRVASLAHLPPGSALGGGHRGRPQNWCRFIFSEE